MQMKIASNEVIHFVGIGGIGMSGLAQIMHNMDIMIQGSDLSQSKNIDRLKKFLVIKRKILKRLPCSLFLLLLKKIMLNIY